MQIRSWTHPKTGEQRLYVNDAPARCYLTKTNFAGRDLWAVVFTESMVSSFSRQARELTQTQLDREIGSNNWTAALAKVEG